MGFQQPMCILSFYGLALPTSSRRHQQQIHTWLGASPQLCRPAYPRPDRIVLVCTIQPATTTKEAASQARVSKPRTDDT